MQQTVPRRCGCRKLLCQFVRADRRAVDHGNLPDAFGNQVLQGFLRHFAGAQRQDSLLVEAFKDLPGEIADSDTGNTHAVPLQLRFATDPFGDM